MTCLRSPCCCAIGLSQRSIAASQRDCSVLSPVSHACSNALQIQKISSTLLRFRRSRQTRPPLPECHFLPDAEPGPSTTGLRPVLGSSPFRTLVRGSEYFRYTLLPLGPRPFKQMGYKIKGGMGFGLSGVYIQRGLCHLFPILATTAMGSIPTREAFHGRKVQDQGSANGVSPAESRQGQASQDIQNSAR